MLSCHEETCCIYGIWYMVDLLMYGELWQTTLLSGMLNWTLCIVIVNILKCLIYVKKLVCDESLIGSWWGDIYIPPTPGSGWGWHWHTLQHFRCWSLLQYPSRQKMLCFSFDLWSRGVRWYSEKPLIVFSMAQADPGHSCWKDWCSLVPGHLYLNSALD